MKNSRKFTAMVAALALAACSVAPMAASFSASAAATASITITGISTTENHTFNVYQVFKGDLTTQTVGEGATETQTKILSNLKWGNGVTAYKASAEAEATTVTAGNDVDEAIVTALTSANARDIVSKFTLTTVEDNIKTMTSSNGTATLNNLEDGYYIVLDTTNLDGKYDANSAWIVQVADEAEVAIKNEKPSVDKQVSDDEDANTTWGETADHAINEQFQFKLTATIPANGDLKAYDTYKLVFHDSMSAGVTYEDIASVTVKVDGKTNVTVPLKNGVTAGYETYIKETKEKAGFSWTLTIDDIKKHLPKGVVFGDSPINVEVVYNAHLNENAIVHNASNGDGQQYKTGETTNINNNNVYLEYSNNPDNTGTGTTDTGKTTDDTVGVFTYQVTNTKYKDSIDDANKMAGAEFKLYSDASCTTEVNLKEMTKDNIKYYIPAAASDTPVTAMISQSDGTFNILGLDVGTYYVKETKAPDGYNLLKEATPITISATHSEVGNGAMAKLDLGESKMAYTYVNKAGSSLPSTGGMGTTLFYLVGGVLVAGAGVTLITKKRVSKNNK